MVALSPKLPPTTVPVFTAVQFDFAVKSPVAETMTPDEVTRATRPVRVGTKPRNPKSPSVPEMALNGPSS